MKGIVFSFNRNSSSKNVRLPQLGSLIKGYSTTLAFVGILLAGLVFGAFYARSADSSFLTCSHICFIQMRIDSVVVSGVGKLYILTVTNIQVTDQGNHTVSTRKDLRTHRGAVVYPLVRRLVSIKRRPRLAKV